MTGRVTCVSVIIHLHVWGKSIIFSISYAYLVKKELVALYD